MAPEQLPSDNFKERLITAIILTLLIIFCESSWLNMIDLPYFNFQETTLN